MENPLSYRNRLASDLRSQRRSIEDSEKFGPEHFFISGKEAYDNFMFPKPFNSQRQKLYDVLKTTQKTEKYITELIHHRQKVNNERREKREKEKEKFLKEYHFSSH